MEKDPKLGWSPTSVPDATRNAYPGVIDEFGRALRNAPCSATTGGAKKPKKPGRPACVCGRRIRVAVSVREADPIVCGICETEFLPEDPTDESRTQTAAGTTTARATGRPTDDRRPAQRFRHDADGHAGQQTARGTARRRVLGGTQPPGRSPHDNR